VEVVMPYLFVVALLRAFFRRLRGQCRGGCMARPCRGLIGVPRTAGLLSNVPGMAPRTHKEVA
jgi:hypothetical protein